MIKIIEYGTKTEIKCDYCGCKFVYEKEDIKYDMIPKEIMAKHINPHVTCPQCNRRIDVREPDENLNAFGSTTVCEHGSHSFTLRTSLSTS